MKEDSKNKGQTCRNLKNPFSSYALSECNELMRCVHTVNTIQHNKVSIFNLRHWKGNILSFSSHLSPYRSIVRVKSLIILVKVCHGRCCVYIIISLHFNTITFYVEITHLILTLSTKCLTPTIGNIKQNTSDDK